MKSEKTRRKSEKTRRKRLTSRNSTYSQDDFDSNNGMLTTVWGPGTWHFLHTMSFNYPVNPSREDKRRYRDFIYSLRYVLPCGKCRKNLKRNLSELPLMDRHMESRDTFSKYVYQLHEKINKMLGKQSGLSYCDVRERYEHFRARCAKVDPEPTAGPPLKKTEPNTGTPSEKADPNKVKPSEKGCTEPLYGEKSRCILKIVPESTKCATMQIDRKCIKRRLTLKKS